jgi:hypothetical protein
MAGKFKTALLCVAALAVAGPVVAQPSLEARVKALEAKVGRLEDVGAIEKLQRAYGYYLDKKLSGEIADLWTENGSVEIAGRGVYVGRAHIERFFRDVLFAGAKGPTQGGLFNHMILQGIVDVDPDGLHAKGRWRAVQTLVVRGTPIYAEGPYEIAYVKEGGVWKIDQMHYYTTFDTDFRAPFVQPRPMNGPNKDFPPDEPQTVVYESWPGTYIPPFHYPNPVSGKPWTAERSKALQTNTPPGEVKP